MDVLGPGPVGQRLVSVVPDPLSRSIDGCSEPGACRIEIDGHFLRVGWILSRSLHRCTDACPEPGICRTEVEGPCLDPLHRSSDACPGPGACRIEIVGLVKTLSIKPLMYVMGLGPAGQRSMGIAQELQGPCPDPLDRSTDGCPGPGACRTLMDVHSDACPERGVCRIETDRPRPDPFDRQVHGRMDVLGLVHPCALRH